MTLSLILGGVGGLALLAAAFTHGHHVGSLSARAALLALPVRRSAWAALLGDMSGSNGSAPRRRPAVETSGGEKRASSAAPATSSALRAIRTRLGVGLGEAARAMGIPASDVDAIERVPLRLLELDTVARYVGALGCRLDVVAVHIDGEALWLELEDPS